MKFLFSARSKTQSGTEYLPLPVHNLTASVKTLEGDGSAAHPVQTDILIANAGAAPWVGVIHIQLPFSKKNPRFFLPAFLYGRNRGEAPQRVHCEFPRLREGTPERPSSPWWMVRSDRLSHPVALVFDSGRVYGFSTSPYFVCRNGKKEQWVPELNGEFLQFGGYSCSLAEGTIGYTIGYENAPLLFVNAYRVHERAPLGDNCFELAPGEALKIRINVFNYPANDEQGINPAIETTYRQYHQPPRKGVTIRAAVSDLSHAVYRDAWLPNETAYAGQVFERQGGYEFSKILSLSWTNGLSVAVPMLLAALRLGSEPMRLQALSCIQNILEKSMNPATGLPFDACNEGVWSNHGWWFDGLPVPGHSSYLCGQALFYLLRAYEFEKRLGGRTHDDWLIYVKKALKRIEPTKNTDNEYPYFFSEITGAGIEYDSFSGTWCLAALAYFSWLTDDRSHLNSLKASEKHYYDFYVRHMECYGAPLDTCKTIDSEGVLAYLRALHYLHALTGESIYLSHMRDAFHYEFSFKFCYNTPIQFPPLSRGWSSCGGSVTSVSNPHIHPMSSSIVDELLYYVGQTGDEYVRSRMIDTIRWGLQTYNTCDREYDFGKKGWMSERFCYSQGLVYQTYPDGSLASTWFCLMPWAVGSILDGLTGQLWDTFPNHDYIFSCNG